MRAAVPLVLVGCGGHASDVLSVIEACNKSGPLYRVLGYLDDDDHPNDARLASRNVMRLGTVDDISSIDAHVVVGIGYPAARAAVVRRIIRFLEPAPPLIHPAARVATGVEVGAGTVLFDGVGVGPLASIGEFAMVGRNATVGHDARVGDETSVMPGCVISGDVNVGEGALLGANSTVLEGRSVGSWATLGAGAVLLDSLPSGCTAVGVPARITHHKS